jgi:(p)ppGpp synthase/HD superfamily hydrolase
MEKEDLLLRDAEQIAVYQHRSQRYDLWPYSKHLEDVVNVGKEFNFSKKLLIACWLHDLPEDGAVSLSKIKAIFGEEITDIVRCVTDPIDLVGRKLKKEQVYKKINTALANKNFDPLKIKLADRIANIRHSKRMQSSQFKMYKKEHEEMMESIVKVDNDCINSMWSEIQELLFN